MKGFISVLSSQKVWWPAGLGDLPFYEITAKTNNRFPTTTLGNDDTSTIGRKVISGFTLIELLVVVLIIGILSAVALPQYELAVGKSRLSQMQQMCRSVKDAAEVYYLANGDYGWIHGHTRGEQFDVTFPAECAPLPNGGIQCGNFQYIIWQSKQEQSCSATYLGGKIWLTYKQYFDHSPSNAGERTCQTVAGGWYPLSARVCRNAGGVQKSDGIFILP